MFFSAGEGAEKVREFFSPNQIDHQIRHAIQFCWTGLAKEKRNASVPFSMPETGRSRQENEEART